LIVAFNLVGIALLGTGYMWFLTWGSPPFPGAFGVGIAIGAGFLLTGLAGWCQVQRSVNQDSDRKPRQLAFSIGGWLFGVGLLHWFIAGSSPLFPGVFEAGVAAGIGLSLAILAGGYFVYRERFTAKNNDRNPRR
jgi:hypothetical protein